MNNEIELIDARQFCVSHAADLSFIRSLHESGLLEITIIEEAVFIPASQLSQLEKMVSFYYDMDINLEGIEALSQLMAQVEAMQERIRLLQNRLRFYETHP